MNIISINIDKNSELSGVAFVRDYIEFYFDGPILRALNMPVVKFFDQSKSHLDEGWRDSLCELIGKKIKGIYIFNDELCKISFFNEDSIEIDIHGDEGESMHFVEGINSPIQVW